MLEELKNMTFANEAEEAAWWESHEDDLANEFEKGYCEGRVGIGTLVRRSTRAVANQMPHRMAFRRFLES